MENITQASFKPENLMAELGSWNKQEQKFRELFSDQAIKDKDFQKLKLAEYDRLWYKYNGKAQTTDERALLVMLRYQRNKMQKLLYPGIITRLVRRAISLIKNKIIQRRENNVNANQEIPYSFNSIPVPDRLNGNNQSQEQAQQTRPVQRYGQNLGKRLRNDHNNKKGQSI